jgi:hypothetical protein
MDFIYYFGRGKTAINMKHQFAGGRRGVDVLLETA